MLSPKSNSIDNDDEDDDVVHDNEVRASTQRAEWRRGRLIIENEPNSDTSTDHIQTGSHLSRHHYDTPRSLGLSPPLSVDSSATSGLAISPSGSSSDRPAFGTSLPSAAEQHSDGGTDHPGTALDVASTIPPAALVSEALDTKADDDGIAVPPPMKRSKIYGLVFFAALGGFLFGYDTAVINSAQIQMSHVFGFDLDGTDAGLLVSLAVVGAFVGALAAGLGSAVFSRRLTMGVADVFFVAGSAILAGARTMWMAYLGRLIVGFGIGIASVLSPVYLAEVSSPESRGAIILANSLAITGSQFIAGGFGGLFVGVTSDNTGWRCLFAIGVVPALTQLIGVIFMMPESPRWLLTRGRVKEATVVFLELGLPPPKAFFLDSPTANGADGSSPAVLTPTPGAGTTAATGSGPLSVDSESQPGVTPQAGGASCVNEGDHRVGARNSPEMAATSVPASATAGSVPAPGESTATGPTEPLPANGASVARPPSNTFEENEDNTPLLSTTEVLRGIFSSREMLYRLFVGCSLQALQQLVGVNAVMYYSSTILKNVGFKGNLISVLLSIPLSFINGIATIIATSLIERWGRRSLVLRTLIGCILFLLGMTILGHYIETNSVNQVVGGWVFLVLLGLFMFCYGPGMGSVPWVVIAEVYPNALRGGAAALATMSNWAFDALVSQCFPMMMGSIGVSATFGILTAFNTSAFLFALFFMPETKGVSLELMTRVFAKVPLPLSQIPKELLESVLWRTDAKEEQKPLKSSSPSMSSLANSIRVEPAADNSEQQRNSLPSTTEEELRELEGQSQ